MSKNEQLWEAIGVLMNQSLWGQNSSVNSLISNLQSEVDEFISACKNNDSRNAWEEASDILMILMSILYKYFRNEDSDPDELVERVVEKLHWRYANIYDNKLSESEESEEGQWKDAKAVEHQLSVMFCPNRNCSEYLKVNNRNISSLDDRFICNSCGKTIIPSQKNTLFFRYKGRSVLLDTFCKAVLLYAKGDRCAPDSLLKDNPRAFRALSNQLSMSKENLDDIDYREILSEYISRKFSVDEQVVLSFLDDIMIIKNSINEQDSLVKQYYDLVSSEQCSARSMFSATEWDKIKKSLKSFTFDVDTKVEKAISFNARSWDNQVTQKYLLKYPDKYSSSIIECMTILHYKGECIRDLTIEISNMYNCPVGCRFCASGALPGAVQVLEPMDYIRQINTCIKESGIDPNDFEHFFVSFAGIGEPSAVYKNIAGGMAIIKDLYPHVQFNIATFGYDLDCFSYWEACHLPIRTLQIPLYHTNSEKLKLIVANLPTDYQITTVVEKAIQYQNDNHNCRIKINYIPMKGKNDSEDEINSYIQSLLPYQHRIIIKVAFLNYTKPADKNGFVCPEVTHLNWIVTAFKAAGFKCYLFGTETNTLLGCGQLAQNSISGNNN